MSRPIALIDADVLCYQIAFANELSFDWGDGNGPVTLTEPELALASVNDNIKSTLEKVNADRAWIVLSDRHINWRKQLEPTYKENRNARSKPELWHSIRDYLEFGDHGAKVVQRPRLEGDDVLGIIATHPKWKSKVTVVSIDKDMETIPCFLFNPMKPEKGVRKIDRENAHWFHMMQTLMGDTVDNYKGLPGVGPKKAAKALAFGRDPLHMWEIVLDMYHQKGMTREDAIHQARLAYILWYGDYNSRTEKVKLWNPKKLQG